jgi:hypothetical protein
MTKQHLTMLAMIGAVLAAVSQAQAQTFNNQDLLLDFRSYSTQSDPDVTVDLGSVSAFVSTVASLPGGTAVLDTGSGFTATSAAGLPSGFSWSGLTSAVGAPSSTAPVNAIGFSAAAEDNVSETLWLTRTQSTGTLTPPTHQSVQQNASQQGLTATAIANIGEEYAGLNSDQTQLSGSGVNAQSYPSGDNYSYQTQGQGPGTPNIITYGATQPTAAPAGGVLEIPKPSTGSSYLALEEVPVLTTGADVYEGFFTFKSDGEIDFTTATVSAVPEPATYGLLAGLGLLAVAMRRQFRSMIA